MSNPAENALANLLENVAHLVQRRVDVEGLDGAETNDQARSDRCVVEEHMQRI